MCEIKWIDDKGNPTPDDNLPIGRVRCKMFDWRMGVKQSTFIWSRWFTICENHAKRLSDAEMDIWEFELVGPDGEKI